MMYCIRGGNALLKSQTCIKTSKLWHTLSPKPTSKVGYVVIQNLLTVVRFHKQM